MKQPECTEISSLLTDSINEVVLMPNLTETSEVGGGGEALREEEELNTQTEEAAKPTAARDPRCPTPQERAEHNLTHLPFRS